jgi:hypothetical protein
MYLSRKKLYSIFSISLASGYFWLYYVLTTGQGLKNNSVEVCLIKRITSLPCPSCGSTRSILSLLHGNFLEALSINPIGILIAFIMILTPLLILLDYLTKKETLYHIYCQIEDFLRKPKFALPLIILLLINWVWNISKGL